MEPAQQAELVSILRAAHQIAKICQPQIPKGIYEYSNTVFKAVTPQQTKDAVVDMGDVALMCAHNPELLDSCGGTLVELSASIAAAGYHLMDHEHVTKPASKPAVAYIAAVKAFACAAPAKANTAMHGSSWATQELGKAIIAAEAGGNKLCGRIASLFGLTKDNWPIFVQLMIDGRPFWAARNVATMI